MPEPKLVRLDDTIEDASDVPVRALPATVGVHEPPNAQDVPKTVVALELDRTIDPDPTTLLPNAVTVPVVGNVSEVPPDNVICNGYAPVNVNAPPVETMPPNVTV
jgi:hypothetical protein